jgi:hypothetical protein
MTKMSRVPNEMRHLAEETIHRPEEIEAELDHELVKLQQLQEDAAHTLPFLDSWGVSDTSVSWREEILTG